MNICHGRHSIRSRFASKVPGSKVDSDYKYANRQFSSGKAKMPSAHCTPTVRHTLHSRQLHAGKAPFRPCLYCNIRLDCRMWVIPLDLEILDSIIIDIRGLACQAHPR